MYNAEYSDVLLNAVLAVLFTEYLVSGLNFPPDDKHVYFRNTCFYFRDKHKNKCGLVV